MTLGAVGDVFLNRDNPAAAFEHTQSLLGAADIMFGNCEGAFTEATDIAPSCGFRVVSATRNAAPLGRAGFAVMAAANNHIVDAGHAGVLDTIKALRNQGIAVVGVGAHGAAAYRPVILERKSTKIGFLAYTTVFQSGYDARAGIPGAATVRIHASPYFPDWDPYGRLEPGARPHMRTYPYPEDLETLTSAISELGKSCDLVVLSMHWGNSSRPVVLTDYEKIIGHAAIDAGAVTVLGHHHHFMKGIEIYRGKPIFYGLGHFAFDLPGLEKVVTPEMIRKLDDEFDGYAIYPREGYPSLPFHPDARMTVIAYIELSAESVCAIHLVPCEINRDNQPVPQKLTSNAGRSVTSYIEKITREAGFETQFADTGAEYAGFQAISVVLS